MKISAINSSDIKQNKANKNNPTFKGGVNSLVNFWQFVDNGGRALQFTVEDMFGTNFPRTYKGAMAGYKYTGKVNIPALLQEAIREFLTGPVMCITPVVVLGLAKKSGKTANTHIENINNLSYLMQQAAENKDKINGEDFLRTTIKDLIKKTSGREAIDDDVDSLLEAFKAYKKEADILADKESVKQIGKKVAKSKVAEKMKELQETFEGVIKQAKEDFKNTDFTQVKYSINESKEGTTSFKNYAEYITAYLQDFTKKFNNGDTLNATEENIKAFRKSFLGKRIITVASMFAFTGLLMSFIPKIYTWASGGVNPNASAIYKEANKNKGGDVK